VSFVLWYSRRRETESGGAKSALRKAKVGRIEAAFFKRGKMAALASSSSSLTPPISISIYRWSDIQACVQNADDALWTRPWAVCGMPNGEVEQRIHQAFVERRQGLLNLPERIKEGHNRPCEKEGRLYGKEWEVPMR
jgi:hypothetical protein